MSEPAALDPSAAAALVAAAAASLPPDAALEAIRARAFELVRMVPAVAERAAVLAGCRPVTGILASAEESKGRGLLTIHATMGTPKRSQKVVDGRPVENLRTAWLNEPAGRALFEQARSLLGRHCRFGKWVEQVDAETKVSMVEWIEDLGVAEASTTAPVTTVTTPPPAGPRLAAAPTLCSEVYRKAVLAMARQLTEPQREAFIAWMKANGVPPLIHPDLTAEQAAKARAFLAHIDDVAGAA